MRVELTERGSVRIDARCADEIGAAEGVLVRADESSVSLTMLPGNAVGGLILNRTSAAGDRAVLVVAQIRDLQWNAGVREAEWDARSRTLCVPLCVEDGVVGSFA